MHKIMEASNQRLVNHIHIDHIPDQRVFAHRYVLPRNDAGWVVYPAHFDRGIGSIFEIEVAADNHVLAIAGQTQSL